MSHERTELRNAIVTQLKGPSNNRTSAGARVVKSRQEPTKTDQLPLISVYSVDEAISEGSRKNAPRELNRTCRVEIIGWLLAESSSAVDDALDALALQIETAMDLDPGVRSAAEVTAGSPGYAIDSVLEETKFATDLSGERPLGMVALTYACTYNTAIRNALPTADFALAGVQTSIDGDQATADQAGDLVVIPIV